MVPGEKQSIYLLGWPSFVGGADTKFAHLLILLHKDYKLTVIPSQTWRLREKVWTRFMDRLGVKYLPWRAVPRKLEGFALSLCNPRFFKDNLPTRAKDRGLTVIWSSEMNWHHPGELAAIKKGLVDRVLYVSELQKRKLSNGYGRLPSFITGNYIDPSYFPFQSRHHPTFTIGRLSRPDCYKYPEDFPVFYEGLGLPDTRFRVMAWSWALARKYRWHRFDARWELLPPAAEPQLRFLYSLDLFVFPLGYPYTEVWGRAVVEAMLTGCIPLVPKGHHFSELIVPTESGFICSDFLEYKHWANRLYHDFVWREKIARQCHQHAVHELCDAKKHLEIWREVFQ